MSPQALLKVIEAESCMRQHMVAMLSLLLAGDCRNHRYGVMLALHELSRGLVGSPTPSELVEQQLRMADTKQAVDAERVLNSPELTARFLTACLKFATLLHQVYADVDHKNRQDCFALVTLIRKLETQLK